MTNKNNWEKEFDKQFPNSRGVFANNDRNGFRRNEIKGFIRDLLAQQKEELLKSLPKERKMGRSGKDKSYNSCLEEIKRIIKEI